MFGPEHIMVLCERNEDDEILFRHAARKAGVQCEIRSFLDGNAALEYMRQAGQNHAPVPRAIFFAKRLHGCTSRELLVAARANPALSDVPMVFLSGSINPADEAEARELGACACLEKPMRPELFHQLSKQLGRLTAPG